MGSVLFGSSLLRKAMKKTDIRAEIMIDKRISLRYNAKVALCEVENAARYSSDSKSRR